MHLLRTFTLFLIVSVSFLGMAQTKSQSAIKEAKIKTKDFNAKKLQNHIKSIMQKIPTSPGVAVAIVKGDKTIFAEGFGYRNLKEKLPVNAQTQFYLASTTKSFTAATAKILAEEGKIDLDVPIKTYFPNLKLEAPLSEEQITLRDLLTHRGGIRNNSIGFRTSYSGQYDADIILKMLSKYSTPRSPAYSYSNLGYVLTGIALEKATNENWKKLSRDKIFDPLGMKNTTSYASKAKNSGNYALPYRSDAGGFTELPYKNDATMHAAGGTVSSAEDLAKWLNLIMNDGKFEGKQIISSRAMKEILSPQINQDRTFYKYHRYSYGLGWNIATYKGEDFIHCFGTYAGFRPHVSFMPEHNIGVVVLVNESSESIMLPDLIANEIYDYLLGKKELNAESNAEIEDYLDNIKRRREQIAARTINTSVSTNKATPTFPLDKYAGTYQSDEYGEIEISIKGDILLAQIGNLSANLAYEKDNSFQADFLVFSPMNITFKSSANKEIQDLLLDEDKFIKVK